MPRTTASSSSLRANAERRVRSGAYRHYAQAASPDAGAGASALRLARISALKRNEVTPSRSGPGASAAACAAREAPTESPATTAAPPMKDLPHNILLLHVDPRSS